MRGFTEMDPFEDLCCLTFFLKGTSQNEKFPHKIAKKWLDEYYAVFFCFGSSPAPTKWYMFVFLFNNSLELSQT